MQPDWSPRPGDLIANDVELWLEDRSECLQNESLHTNKELGIIPIDSSFIFLGVPLQDETPAIVQRAKRDPHVLWFGDRPVYVSRIELWTWFRSAGRTE